MTLHSTTSTTARRISGREAAEMDQIRTRATQFCDRRTVAGSDSQQVIARAFRFCTRRLSVRPTPIRPFHPALFSVVCSATDTNGAWQFQGAIVAHWAPRDGQRFLLDSNDHRSAGRAVVSTDPRLLLNPAGGITVLAS